MTKNYIQTCIDINGCNCEFNQYYIEEILNHNNVNIRYNVEEKKIFLSLYQNCPMAEDIEKSSKTILNYDNKLFCHYRTYYIENKVVFTFYCNQNLYYDDGEWKIRNNYGK